MEFRKQCKKLLGKFPISGKFNLTLQISRAIDSICLNIAEGSNRISDKDKAHFLNQALTSLEEVFSGFDLALDDQYITDKEMKSVLIVAEEIGKQ